MKAVAPGSPTLTSMPRSAEELLHAMASLQGQRALLGDAVADTALEALKTELAALALASQPSLEQQGQQPAQQLRLVSVLFLDIVGSTALSGKLHPEDVMAVIGGALAAFSAAIDQHGGRVLQYAGDSLLAAFGADEVHEDDAERAVLAALALLRLAQQHAAQVEAQHRLSGFDVRVGIHSGEVLLGGGLEGEAGIRGNAVNLAARMEQSAPPGALRISQDTWRLVRGLFEMQAQPPLQVKGHAQALQTWIVTRPLEQPRSAALRGVDGVRSPLLGRAADLARLHEACAAPGCGTRLVVVVAEAGLGKSRLFDEWLLHLQQAGGQAGATPVLRATARERSRAYGLLRELVRNALGLPHDGSDPGTRQLWLQALQQRLSHSGSAAVLGQLLGLDCTDHAEVRALLGDGKTLRDQAFFHATQVLAGLQSAADPWLETGSEAPRPGLVLALDDAHWADDGTLDFVQHLLDTQRPWCLLLLARPTLFERRPAWTAGSAARLTHIELQPLDEATCHSLAQSLLQRLAAPTADLPGRLTRLVAEGGEGNPFFIEERVNMLIDQGTIRTEGEHWTLQAPALETLQLPTTLQGLLQARLDALPPAHRRALQLAAVAGEQFWDQALAVLDPMALQALDDLQQRQLIIRKPTSRLAGASEYGFRHHSLYQVAYDSVLKRVKRNAHRSLAAWLALQPGAETLADPLAEHLERGGQAEEARLAWQRAAESARHRFANADALAHAKRALALTDPDLAADLPLRMALTLLRVRVLEAMSDREGQSQSLQALQQMAQVLDDPAWHSETCVRSSRWEFHFGDVDRALYLAQRALELAPAEQTERRARAWGELTQVLCRLARLDEAQAAAEQALALARQAGQQAIEASALNQLGMLAFDRGDIPQAVGHYEQALALHRHLAHLANEGGTLCNLACAAMAIGNFDAAQQQFEQASALCDRVGQRQNQGIIETNLGIVALQRGQGDVALAHAQLALQRLRTAGDRWAEAAALRVAGQAALAQGRQEQARDWLLQALDAFETLKLDNLALEVMAALAEEALARNDIAAAVEQAEAMLQQQARGAGIEGTDEPMRIPLALWRALHAAGDPRADVVLAQARQTLLARAERLAPGPARQGFLNAVGCHREILAASAGPESGPSTKVDAQVSSC